MSDEPPVKGTPANLTAPRFEKGRSGNPGGRPKDDPKFRAWCRKLTWETAGRIMDKIRNQPDEVSVSDMTAAFKAFANRGGFLEADRQAAVEVSRARIILALLELGALTPEEKERLLGSLETHLKGVAIAA